MVDASGTIKNGFKIKIETEEGKQFIVRIENGTINTEDKNAIKESEWNKKKVYMQLNARILRGIINKSVLVSAKKIK